MLINNFEDIKLDFVVKIRVDIQLKILEYKLLMVEY
jgi:hypothetical protein